MVLRAVCVEWFVLKPWCLYESDSSIVSLSLLLYILSKVFPNTSSRLIGL